MITHVEFKRFRGFERLHAELSPHAYIVGPNSAGKSTIIEAISMAEHCLRTARRKSPSLYVQHRGCRWKAFGLPKEADSTDDPVRHDFSPQETHICVHWSTGGAIHIVWPETDSCDEAGFFYLVEQDGGQPRTTAAVRKIFAPVTIVPVVSPFDRIEPLKDADYVEKHSSSRLASRHFRNHAWIMSKSSQWSLFKDFAKPWMPELNLQDVSFSTETNRLGVFYSEANSRIPKELAWAGDGIQIWVQLLWHLFRAQGASTILLDEPEVYLHPDLQRRLVRVLDGTSAQIILASHSADVIAEAPPDCVLWVDRRASSARRTKSQQSLHALSSSLGSSFNLALARSMRSRLVVATDCDDLRVVRQIAKNIGAANLANEHLVSLVQLRSTRNCFDLELLGQSLREVLPGGLPAVLLLQGGHRSKMANNRITDSLSASNIRVVVLPRAEIENYLLDTETIARVSGAAPEVLDINIAEVCQTLQEPTKTSFISEWLSWKGEGLATDTVTEAASLFEELWGEQKRKMELVRGTHIISQLNKTLECGGYRLLTAHSLAKAIKPHNLTNDLLDAMFQIDESLK